MTPEPREHDLSARTFHAALLAISLLFLAQQIAYVTRFPLIMDEFIDAQAVRATLTAVPYRDYPSTKTVGGYYLQAPAMLLVPDLWDGMIAIKIEMVLLTAAVMAYAALRLARRYSRVAVLTGLVLLYAMSTFSERCSELRSDMPTSIFGLIALILLLEDRPALSGVFVSVSLMMSQKAAYYVLASEAALFALIVIFRRRQTIRDFIVYNAAAGITFAAYLAFWSIIATPAKVFGKTFVGPAKLAFMPYPAQFWPQTLHRNPFYYTVAAGAILYLLVRGFRRDGRSLSLGVYAFVLCAFCIWHKQPWPYFFVILIPTLFVAQVPAIDAAMTRLRMEKPWLRRLAAAAVAVFGVAIPLATRLPPSLQRDNRFQHAMFRLGSALLADGSQYVAGTPIYYTHPHAVADELNSLDGIEQARIHAKSPQELVDLVRRLDAAPVKFLVYNYRIKALPGPVLLYLRSTFAPYWGDIFVYAPHFLPGTFRVKFGGRYRALTEGVVIDGRHVSNGETIVLAAGEHHAETARPFRLAYLPDINPALLDPAARDFQEFFPNVYAF